MYLYEKKFPAVYVDVCDTTIFLLPFHSKKIMIIKVGYFGHFRIGFWKGPRILPSALTVRLTTSATPKCTSADPGEGFLYLYLLVSFFLPLPFLLTILNGGYILTFTNIVFFSSKFFSNLKLINPD